MYWLVCLLWISLILTIRSGWVTLFFQVHPQIFQDVILHPDIFFFEVGPWTSPPNQPPLLFTYDEFYLRNDAISSPLVLTIANRPSNLSTCNFRSGYFFDVDASYVPVCRGLLILLYFHKGVKRHMYAERSVFYKVCQSLFSPYTPVSVCGPCFRPVHFRCS